MKYTHIYTRTIAITLITLLLTTFAHAETVSQKQAAAIAETFFNASKGMKMAPPKMAYNGRPLTTNRLFAPFYVYNHPTGGFVIISAENKAYPILAYNLKENFDIGKIDEGTKALLTLYALHIENIRYDSRIPDNAIRAWEDISHEIHSILSAQYDLTDVIDSWENTTAEIDNVWDRADADQLFSDIYTPDQWAEMINTQLSQERNVTMGVIYKDDLIPMVMHGRKGEYYRLNFGQRSTTLFRLFPTEFLSVGEVALLTNPTYIAYEEPSEAPFSFYNQFIEEQQETAKARQSAIEERLNPTAPVVEWEGSGHFRVTMPDNVAMARIYNVAGALFQEQYFRETTVANLDILNAPSGFYFALLITEAGVPYSVKLYR
jgi:hypothetical protein